MNEDGFKYEIGDRVYFNPYSTINYHHIGTIVGKKAEKWWIFRDNYYLIEYEYTGRTEEIHECKIFGKVGR